MANASTGGEPFAEFRRILGEWRLPNLDLDAVAQCQRKNIAALTQANQLALEGAQAWMQRNLELARQAMEDTQAMMRDLTKPDGSMEDRLARQAEYSKKAIEKGLDNFRDLTDLMAKANTDAVNVITRRVTESLEEVRDYTQKAA